MLWVNSKEDGGPRDLAWEIRSQAGVCVCVCVCTCVCVHTRLRLLVALDTIGVGVNLARMDMDFAGKLQGVDLEVWGRKFREPARGTPWACPGLCAPAKPGQALVRTWRAGGRGWGALPPPPLAWEHAGNCSSLSFPLSHASPCTCLLGSWREMKK